MSSTSIVNFSIFWMIAKNSGWSPRAADQDNTKWTFTQIELIFIQSNECWEQHRFFFKDYEGSRMKESNVATD